MADDLAPGPQGPAAEPQTQISVPDGGKPAMSVRDAARILQSARRTAEETNSQDQSAPPAPPPAKPSVPEADANPPSEGHGETAEIEATPEESPINPPVSWTTEAKERWQSLPRDTQEYIAQRESERERLLTKGQTETAAERKNYESERQRMEQARQQYEGALPALVQALQQSIAGDFPDVQTQADVDRLAREDWARYILWDASQKKYAGVVAEAQAAQQRQTSDLQGRWNTFASEQDAAFMKAAPEFADKEKAAALQRSAVKVLTEIGFTEDELARNWNGQQALSLRDHRLQLLIRDGVRYREAQAAVKKGGAPVRNVPPVTRPGVAPSPGKALEGQIREIETALSKTTSQSQGARLAATLQSLRRELASR
jgi:hypothetical protein